MTNVALDHDQISRGNTERSTRTDWVVSCIGAVTLPARMVLTKVVGTAPTAVVTSTLMTQLLFAAMVALPKLMLDVPAAANNVPPQLALAFGTGALIKPAG